MEVGLFSSLLSINWLESVVTKHPLIVFTGWSRRVKNLPKSLTNIILKKRLWPLMYLKKLPNAIRVIFTKFIACNKKLLIKTGS